MVDPHADPALPRRAGPLARLLAAPLMCCGFRPFFLAAALWAALAVLGWMLMLSGLAPMAAAPLAGPVWHAHEMVWGFGMAAVVGFLLTAVPEFTATPSFSPRDTAWLLALWLAARLLGAAGLAGAHGSVTALWLGAALAWVFWA